MRTRKVAIVMGVAAALVMAGAVPAMASGANINPTSQTTVYGTATWTGSWSGPSGSVSRFYRNSNGSLGYYSVATSFKTSYTWDSCLSSHYVGQELDVLSGSSIVAAATSTTYVKQTNPC